MTARRCLPWPHPGLRAVAADVPAITDEVRAIWRDMVDTMEAMPGYGLAAVQIGVPLRLAANATVRASPPPLAQLRGGRQAAPCPSAPSSVSV